MSDYKDKIAHWIAMRAPKRLCYWCAIRVAAFVTTGTYGKRTPDEVNLIEMLGDYKERQL